ncbi:hypothetical protein GALMADRAFT_251761 [Galerina marginata CBS 339.88]|uniref:N-acetyltransferase domain-containing protein n=1 Tax=Galerina marginata (strain CBS 339.88) TaxID=685588 RepID=A0A067SQJ9_GALM3|nr:hypothetical protein GALMADRAFT_251761 [Galerina marginata CBS 339.88]
MKANTDTVLIGSRVILVPYRSEHVPKYHEWMLDEELRSLTASEPLSLEEEYEMQEKWQLDEDKLTFIILSRQSKDGTTAELPEPPTKLLPTDDLIAGLPMVGDVNIFLHGVPPHLHQQKGSSAVSDVSASVGQQEESDEDDFHAEVEIMIAESSFRRKGLAIEALQLMLGYATGQPPALFSTVLPGSRSPATARSIQDSRLKIPPECLITRISDTNFPSIRLFEKLGFEITKRVEVFQEVEMRFKLRL